jgi:hypothetical protein
MTMAETFKLLILARLFILEGSKHFLKLEILFILWMDIKKQTSLFLLLNKELNKKKPLNNLKLVIIQMKLRRVLENLQDKKRGG